MYCFSAANLQRTVNELQKKLSEIVSGEFFVNTNRDNSRIVTKIFRR